MIVAVDPDAGVQREAVEKGAVAEAAQDLGGPADHALQDAGHVLVARRRSRDEAGRTVAVEDEDSVWHGLPLVVPTSQGVRMRCSRPEDVGGRV